MESDNSENKRARLLEPLTHTNKDGKRYQRLPEVENQIRVALELDAKDLVTRATVSDKSSPDFLKEEALVYLIRHYHGETDKYTVTDLTRVLIVRIVGWVESKLRKLGIDAVEEGYADVVERLFKQILNLDSDRGDYLQVRFWRALKMLTVRVFDEQLEQFDRRQNSVPLSSLTGYDDGDPDASGNERKVKVPDSATCRSAESQATDEIFNRQAMWQLKEPFRSAYLLRHYYDWPIESQDPAVQTISQRFGKTPRTIRNWLTKADKELSIWLGEQE